MDDYFLAHYDFYVAKVEQLRSKDGKPMRVSDDTTRLLAAILIFIFLTGSLWRTTRELSVWHINTSPRCNQTKSWRAQGRRKKESWRRSSKGERGSRIIFWRRRRRWWRGGGRTCFQEKETATGRCKCCLSYSTHRHHYNHNTCRGTFNCRWQHANNWPHRFSYGCRSKIAIPRG